ARAMADTPAVCEQLHFPLQSGSDRILARMHRGYNRRKYMERLAMAREIIPGLAVSPDIIVGFPGWTGDDLESTGAVVEESRVDRALRFRFAPRPGAAAAGMPHQVVPDEAIQELLARLAETQSRITLERNHEMLGRDGDVLGGGSSKRPGMA